MNDSEQADDASKGSMRKGIIIGIVVIVTAAVFTLGYFVGRLTGSGGEPVPSVVVAKPKPDEAPVRHESAPVNAVSQTPLEFTVEKTGDQKCPPSVPLQGIVPEKAEKAANKGDSVRKGSVKGETPEAPAGSTPASPKKEIIYTVQLGAFKSQADAENMRAKFDKKGYRTYIMQVKGKTGKVYKVRTGEFSEKKDAEVLSLKLKKTEGVSAFVTFRNE